MNDVSGQLKVCYEDKDGLEASIEGLQRQLDDKDMQIDQIEGEL